MSDYRISARAIMIHEGKILLNEFGHGKYYNLPGGGVEQGETLRDAVEREVLEETGLTAKSRELLYVMEYNPMRDKQRYGSRGALSSVFKCDINFDIPAQMITEYDKGPEYDATGAKWIDLDDLKNIALVPKIADIILRDYHTQNLTTQFLEDTE